MPCALQNARHWRFSIYLQDILRLTQHIRNILHPNVLLRVKNGFDASPNVKLYAAVCLRSETSQPVFSGGLRSLAYCWEVRRVVFRRVSPLLLLPASPSGCQFNPRCLRISEAVFSFRVPLWAMTVLGLLSKQLFADAVLGHSVAHVVFDNLFTTVSLV